MAACGRFGVPCSLVSKFVSGTLSRIRLSVFSYEGGCASCPPQGERYISPGGLGSGRRILGCGRPTPGFALCPRRSLALGFCGQQKPSCARPASRRNLPLAILAPRFPFTHLAYKPSHGARGGVSGMPTAEIATSHSSFSASVRGVRMPFLFAPPAVRTPFRRKASTI